jgi:hypothetical protein
MINVKKDELLFFIQEALLAGKHHEFFTLSKKVNLDQDLIVSACAKEVISMNRESFRILEKFILNKLNS